jgi:hypothetical protein
MPSWWILVEARPPRLVDRARGAHPHEPEAAAQLGEQGPVGPVHRVMPLEALGGDEDGRGIPGAEGAAGPRRRREHPLAMEPALHAEVEGGFDAVGIARPRVGAGHPQV